jgi:hypothetical protein
VAFYRLPAVIDRNHETETDEIAIRNFANLKNAQIVPSSIVYYHVHSNIMHDLVSRGKSLTLLSCSFVCIDSVPWIVSDGHTVRDP